MLIIGAGSGNDVAVADARGATASTPSRSTATSSTSAAATPTGPTTTRASSPTSPTAGRSSSRPTASGTRSCSPCPTRSPSSRASRRCASRATCSPKEAVESYRDHLAAGGVFAMYNYYREPWLVDRYAGTLEEVFGDPPCVSHAERQRCRCSSSATTRPPSTAPPDELFTAPRRHARPGHRRPPVPVPAHARASPASTCCRSPSCSRSRSSACASSAARSARMRPFADLFFMGVAFLLLETKNVVQFALLFGTTWFVNALVFSGVLVSVLLAVAISKRVVIRRTGVALRRPARQRRRSTGSCRAARCWSCRTCPRLVVAVVLAFLPIFVANLVFANRFRDTDDSTAAFGANLLGAMVGGLLEYTSLVIGYRQPAAPRRRALRRRLPAAAARRPGRPPLITGCLRRTIRAIREPCAMRPWPPPAPDNAGQWNKVPDITRPHVGHHPTTKRRRSAESVHRWRWRGSVGTRTLEPPTPDPKSPNDPFVL